jgi:hypothetical protein
MDLLSRDSVLGCGSPLPLSHQLRNRGPVLPKRQRTGALQNLADLCDPRFIESPNPKTGAYWDWDREAVFLV